MSSAASRDHGPQTADRRRSLRPDPTARRRGPRSVVRGLAVLAVAAVLSGCVSLEMGRIGDDLARGVEGQGAEVGDGFAVAFGPGTIGSTRFLGRLVAPESTEPYRRLSRHVRRVKLARYPVVGAFDARAVPRPALLDRYQSDGWSSLVTARDEESAVWVLMREDGDGVLTDLLAVVASAEDLVVTRMSGDLSAFILDAIEEGRASDLLGGALDDTGLVGE